MPRNGADVYSKPSGSTAVAGTTIESAVFNAVIDDLVLDANTARPINAGGTGSASAIVARQNLGVKFTLANPAALRADTTLSYTAAAGKFAVTAGDVVEAGGVQYIVAVSGASDHLMATAGGVKLYRYGNTLRLSDLTDGTGTIAAETAIAQTWAASGKSHLICDLAISVDDELTLATSTQMISFEAGGGITQTVANKRTIVGVGDYTNFIVVNDWTSTGFGATDTASTANADFNTASAQSHGIFLDKYKTADVWRPKGSGFKNSGVFINFVLDRGTVWYPEVFGTHDGTGSIDSDIPLGDTNYQQFCIRFGAHTGSRENWRSATASGSELETDASAAHGGGICEVIGGEVGNSGIGIYVAPGYKEVNIRDVYHNPAKPLSQHVVYAQAGDNSTTVLNTDGEPDGVIVKIAYPAQSRRFAPPSILVDGVHGKNAGGSPLVSLEGIDKEAASPHPWVLDSGPSRKPAIAPVIRNVHGRDGQDWLVSVRNAIDYHVSNLSVDGMSTGASARIETLYASGTVENAPNIGNCDADVASFKIPLGGYARLKSVGIDRGNMSTASAQLSFVSQSWTPRLTVNGVTTADPAIVSFTGSHGLEAGESIDLYFEDIGGTTEANGIIYRGVYATGTTVTLQDLDGNDIDGTGWTAYTSGGEAYFVTQAYPITTGAYWPEGAMGQDGLNLYRCKTAGVTDGSTISLSAQAGEQTSGTAGFVFFGNARNLWADCHYVFFNAESSAFTVGEVAVGGTSGAEGLILAVESDGTSGYLVLGTIFGTFANGETITDTATGSATANIPDGVVFAHLGHIEIDHLKVTNAGSATFGIFQNDRRIGVEITHSATPPGLSNRIKGTLWGDVHNDLGQNTAGAPDTDVTDDNALIILEGISRTERGVFASVAPDDSGAVPALRKRYWPDGAVVVNTDATAGGFRTWTNTAAGTPGTWKTSDPITS